MVVAVEVFEGGKNNEGVGEEGRTRERKGETRKDKGLPKL